MKRIVSLVLLLLTVTTSGTVTFALDGGDAAGAACSVVACGVGGIFYILIIAVAIAIPIILIVVIIKFIRKDAISRGMPNADSIKWLGLLGVLGLVIYLLQRPDIVLVACPRCGTPGLPGRPCAQCGNA